CLQGYRPPYSV
nr:immunoglobulin light chain junction region [Macaca mulatta]